MRNIFLQKSCWKWDSETSPRLQFAFQKIFIWSKSKWSALWFQYIMVVLDLDVHYKSVQYKLHKISDCWFRDMLNFDFLKKDLGLVSLPHFVYDFSRKMFLMLYSINWGNFIVSRPLLLEILDNTCFETICFPVYDVIRFQFNLSFLIKPFFYLTMRVRTKYLNTLRTNKESF